MGIETLPLHTAAGEGGFRPSTLSCLMTSLALRFVASLHLILALSLFWGASVYAQGQEVDVVPTSGATWPLVLHTHAKLLEDATGSLRVHEVRELAASRWRPAGPNVPSFGFSRSAWWLHIRLHNAEQGAAQRVVELPQPVQDLIELHVFDAESGKYLAAYLTGDRLPFSTRPVEYLNFLFPLTVEPGQQIDLYLRLATHDGLHEAAPLLLWNLQSFFEYSTSERLVFGLYYGGLLVLLFYNLFLFVSTRERLFAEYVAYLAAFFLWNFSFRGYAFQHWWPDHPDLGNQILPIAAGLCFVTHSFFTMDYLETRRLSPKLHRLLVALLVLQCASLVPPLLGFYALSWMFMIPLSLVSLLSFMLTAAVLLQRGSRSARYYLLAWSALEAGVMLYYLRLVGILPSNMLTEQGLQIGSALEFVLLAFGMADRMNELKTAKLQAERTALEAQSLQQVAAARAELEQQRMREALLHAGKLATVGRMASGVVHELSHPVGAMALSLGALNTLLSKRDTEQAQALVPELSHEITRIRSLIQRLRNMSRSEPARIAPHDLSSILNDARHLFGPRLAVEGIEYEESVPSVTVKADAELLSLAIANVIGNAADAIASSEHKRITVYVSLDATWAHLSIADSGPGLTPQDLQNLFKSFYTTKPREKGLGLGLALCAEYLAAMGASIQGMNGPRGGAVFRISLPLAE